MKRRAITLALGSALILTGCGVKIIPPAGSNEYAAGYLSGQNGLHGGEGPATWCPAQEAQWVAVSHDQAANVSDVFNQGCADAYVGKAPTMWPSGLPSPQG